ncbi:MAG TPA: hypothetical protein VH572_00495 [Gaiella sp.]
MEIELRPPASPDLAEAVRRAAVEAAALDLLVDAAGPAPASAWLRAVREEAVERSPERPAADRAPGSSADDAARAAAPPRGARPGPD